MMLLRLLLLLAIAGPAFAAAPVISCPPSRTTGTAPLLVHFDCTGTTDADTTKPFHDLFYEHTFGDPSAGTWSYGANTSLSKNYATGAVAAHVYEAAGTYTSSHSVTDGTSVSRTTNTITVTAADTTYSGTNTTCIFTDTLGSGCPSGAATSNRTDFGMGLVDCGLNTGKRCLFKRGNTFTDNVFNLTHNTAGPHLIGAYGSGAKPIINLSNPNSLFSTGGAGLTDMVFVDLDVRGSGTSTDHVFLNNDAASTVLVLRVDASGMGAEEVSFTADCTNCAIVDSTFQTNTAAATVYASLISGAILGNSIGPTSAGAQHTLRVSKCQKCPISSNTVTTSQAGKEVFALRAVAHTTNADDTFYTIVSDNKVIQGANATDILQLSNGGSADVRIYDVILERNWIVATANAGSGFSCRYIMSQGVRITIRNNLLQLARCGDNVYGTYVWAEGGGSQPTPNDNDIYNNTAYSAGVTSNFVGTIINASTTNAIVKQNLCYAPSGGGSTVCVSDAGTGTTNPTQPTAGGNSSTAQTTGTNPLFDGTTNPIDFRVGTTSYAATGGTTLYPASNDDFFHCDDTTSNERLGAFVPRVRAMCRGAAGP